MTTLTLTVIFKFICDGRTSNENLVRVQVWNSLPGGLGGPWLEVVAVPVAGEVRRGLEVTGQIWEGMRFP